MNCAMADTGYTGVEGTGADQEVTVIGPGAGRFQAGQGMLADLIAIARSQ